MTDSRIEDSGRFSAWDPAQDPRWDEFALSHPQGTVYHHSAWSRVISATYGHAPFYLGWASGDGDGLRGIIPFILMDGFLVRRRLVSLPYTAFCPLLMPEDRVDEALRFALDRHPGTPYVEIRGLAARSGDGSPAVPCLDTPFVTQILDLSRSLDDLFLSFHESSIRQRVRRAEREGLAFRTSTDDKDLRVFYRLFSDIRREKGLPIHPFGFFANMRRLMAPLGLFELALVEEGSAVAAAAIVLKGGATWHLEYLATDTRLLKKGPNQLLIWECIKRAHGGRAAWFDFGRTALHHRTLLEFKDRWNTERRVLCRRVFPDDAAAPVRHDPSGSRFLRLNRKLPAAILRWEGRLLFRRRG